MVIIIRNLSTNKDPNAILEETKLPIKSGKNKKKDTSKILAELEKLQELKRSGTVNDYEYDQ